MVIRNFFSSRRWCRKRISLSSVRERSSGKRLLIRPIALSTARIDTGYIFSKKGARLLRSVTFRTNPLPLFPDARKSPSASPMRFLVLIYKGLLEIMRLPSIVTFFFQRFRYFRRSFFRCDSILLPYGEAIYLRMRRPEIEGMSWWYRLIRSATCSGD